MPRALSLNRDIARATGEIARQSAVIRQAYPTISWSDIADAVAWAGNRPVTAAIFLAKMHHRRTHADLAAIREAILDNPNKSNHEIAAIAGVAHSTIRKYRDRLNQPNPYAKDPGRT